MNKEGVYAFVIDITASTEAIQTFETLELYRITTLGGGKIQTGNRIEKKHKKI